MAVQGSTRPAIRVAAPFPSSSMVSPENFNLRPLEWIYLQVLWATARWSQSRRCECAGPARPRSRKSCRRRSCRCEAAFWIASTARSTWLIVNHDLDLHLGQEANEIFGAAIDFGLAFWRPNPLTSLTVRPDTPTPVNKSRTSSSLNGLMMADTSFMDCLLNSVGERQTGV